MILDHEAVRVSSYFSNLLSELGVSKTDGTVVVAVAHLLPTAMPFLSALDEIAQVGAVVPKPKSQDPATVRWVKNHLRCDIIQPQRDDSRAWLEVLGRAIKKPKLRGKSVILVDIGGYFSKVLVELGELIAASGGTLRGVMEGTENGAQAYDDAFPPETPPPTPILTVARSPLKLPEDYLVGAAIVFSIERILREHGQILQTRSACVIGFGRVGSAVASSLRGRGIPTIVNDVSWVKKAEAAAQGYQVYPNLHEAVARSSLIISATSAAALDEQVLANVRNGAAIATVTSRDTEFADQGQVLDEYYLPTPLEPATVVRYDERSVDRYFWLLNDGNAPNFLDGAVIGPALQLIEGEKLAAVAALARSASIGSTLKRSTLREIEDDDRDVVARVWNEHFIGI